MAHNLGAAKRLRKELQNLERASNRVSKQNGSATTSKNKKINSEDDDVYLRPTNASNSILLWTALLRGPTDTPYENGVFQLSIKCGTDYPLSPPSMTFKTRVFHPNVHFRTGDICLDILKKEWSPAWGKSLQSSLLIFYCSNCHHSLQASPLFYCQGCRLHVGPFWHC